MKKIIWAGALLASSALAQDPGANPTAVTSGARPSVTLATGWKFRQDDHLQGAEAPSFDDSGWGGISVPHSWNRVGYYLPDTSRRVNTPASINKTQGVGWYRLLFSTPPSFQGKRAWLEFDAASRIATVWLNGRLLGHHEGGFSRFRLDATDALHASGPNVLAVRVDNSKPQPGSATADVLPLTGDFFVHGGLYRPVRLVATDPVHFDMLDAGGPGVYATTEAIDGGVARILVSAKLRNEAGSGRRVSLAFRLLNAAGRAVAERTRQVVLGTAAGEDVSTTLSVAGARLWQGVADPYLYRLSVKLLAPNGQVLDRQEQPFGIRLMRVDPARGFLLNGRSYPLRGVGYHQDREGKGWAISAADVASDLAIMREMGVNSIRLTHYEHGQAVHDEADRLGLVTWDEIPLVSAWTLGDAQKASPKLLGNARQQLVELIQQNRNHASVASWGIANEVDFGNSLPGFLTNATATPPDPLPLLRNLNALARATDPSRPTATANCCEGQVFAPGVTVPITAPEADLASANRYFGWYYGKPEMVGPALDALHAKRPQQPLAITEYGAGGAVSLHTDNVLGGPIDARGQTQPEEYESYIHEQNWTALRTRPYLWGTWLWSGFDFASTVRHEGDAEDINTKGLVTYDRAVRKDAYFFYRANWSGNPTVHVNGRRYFHRAYAVTDVRVYSNAPRTELSVNGAALPPLTSCAQATCVWRAVRLAAGENLISARGVFPQATIEDRIVWSVAPEVARGVRIDSGALVAARSAAGIFGSDNFFEGGSAATLDKPGGFNKPPVPAEISRTGERALATTYRKGDFRYRIPLLDGDYTVALTFVEPGLGAGERVFDVLADGRPLVAGLDVAREAGGAMSALRRTFPVHVTGGMLTLQFRPVRGEAIVSAVEVIPTQAPVRR